jgi:hypothetical protein
MLDLLDELAARLHDAPVFCLRSPVRSS